MPNFNIVKEPENPKKDSNNGLQKGQVTLKKLKNVPKKPIFADFKDFCLSLMAKICNAISMPPRIENTVTNPMLTEVNEKFRFSMPNLTSIKLVITAYNRPYKMPANRKIKK
jgi:hypothetical protein